MSTFVRITLATFVLTTATATPALAAAATAPQAAFSAASTAPSEQLGLCRIWPKLCTVTGASVPLDQLHR